MSEIEVAKALAVLPSTVLLVLVIVGGYLGWWVYGSVHRAEVDDLRKEIDAANERADSRVDPAIVPPTTRRVHL